MRPAVRLGAVAVVATATALAIDLVPVGLVGAQEGGPLRRVAVAFDANGCPVVDVVPAGGVTGLTIGYQAAVSSEARTAELVPTGARLRATLLGTPAGARVAYEVRRGAEVLAKHELATLPPRSASSITFCALGDSGGYWGGKLAAGKPQLDVARLLEAQRPDLVLHTGDLIYPRGEEDGLDPLVFGVYGATLARVPFLLALGNHDVMTGDGAPSLGAMPYPANESGNRWYSFDAGPVHFVALDSNRIVYVDDPAKFRATDQAKWLEADLAAAKAEWKVVWFHHPLYTGMAKRQRQLDVMRRNVEQLLFDAGVDLIVNGHDHFYWRSHRMLEGKKNDLGMVHVVTGGGGAGLYEFDVADKLDYTASYKKAYHLTRFEVEGSTCTIRALAPGANGPETIDEARFASRRSLVRKFR